MDNNLRDRYRGYQAPRPGARHALPVDPFIPQSPTIAPKPIQVTTPEPVSYSEDPFEDASWRPRAKTPKKGRAKKVFATLFVLLLLAGTGGAGYWYFQKSGQNISGRNPYALGGGRPADGSVAGTNTEQPVAQGTIRLIASGDMIAHDSINQNAKEGDNYNYAKLMDKMKPFFNKADIRFCNQSTPAGGPTFGISGHPVFNAPVEFARGIEGIGCNVINIGTNHTNDKGQPVIDATVAAWDGRENVLAVAGANRNAEEQKKIRYFTVKGMKFAFLSYTTLSNKKDVTPFGLNMYSDALAKSQVEEARKNADFVMVSMRWGTEQSPNITPEQDKIAQTLASLGVDTVLGNGPHVLQPVRRIAGPNNHETLVWYSLGNFLNSQREIESLIGGVASMDIDVASKKITKVSFMPTYMHYEWTAAQKKRGNGADLAARHDFALVPLDQSKDLLAKSQNGTTVEAQTERIKKILNTHTAVTIVSSAEF